MKTTAISILLMISICLAIAGCGNETAPQTTPGAETTLSTEPVETFPTDPVETTAPTVAVTEPTVQVTEPTQEETLPPYTDIGPEMVFTPVSEKVTAKIEVNLRSVPSQGEDSVILHTLENGETVKRTGISSSGWSELTWKGKTCYAVSSYLTTDLDYKPPVQIKTPFTDVNELVTPKDAVNLRTLPSTTHEDVKIVVKLEKGEVVTRTGINEDVGWSRVEYKGQTLYCISSYLKPAEDSVQ